ncbi:MAG: hypothetical protein OXF74_07210 [Rhodobacteraceae bacterium]|nr:hypothetical protein [Paracoccaceae bacterium]
MHSESSGVRTRKNADRRVPPPRLTLSGAAILLLAACDASSPELSADIAGQRKSVGKLFAAIGVASESEREIEPTLSSGDHLPAKLRVDGAIRYASAEPVTLAAALARLEGLTGIPHLLLVGPDEKPFALLEANQPQSAGLSRRLRFDFSDPLPHILDRLAADYGLEWRYEEGSILFREFVTRRHFLTVLPVRSDFSNSVGRTNSNVGIDWPGEVRSALRSIAGAEAIIAYGEGSGFVTIVARPAEQRRIAAYIKDLNGFLDRQVAFDVNVLSVSHRHVKQSGLSLDLFSGDPKDDFIAWSGESPLISGAGAVNVGIITGDAELGLLVTALDRAGEVAVETRTGATTSNNQIVPIQVISETAYARRIEAVPGEGRAATSIEPGTLTTGFEMQLLPRILPDGRVLLRYSIKLSDLNELAEFTSQGQTVQLPKLSTTTFEQQAILGNQETLVLMGFERERKSLDRPGESAAGSVFGFRSGAERERISTVLTIRPRILPRTGG